MVECNGAQQVPLVQSIVPKSVPFILLHCDWDMHESGERQGDVLPALQHNSVEGHQPPAGTPPAQSGKRWQYVPA